MANRLNQLKANLGQGSPEPMSSQQQAEEAKGEKSAKSADFFKNPTGSLDKIDFKPQRIDTTDPVRKISLVVQNSDNREFKHLTLRKKPLNLSAQKSTPLPDETIYTKPRISKTPLLVANTQANEDLLREELEKDREVNLLMCLLGNPSSGKTTISNALLLKLPEDILVIDVQDYYFSVSEPAKYKSQNPSGKVINPDIFIGELDFFQPPEEIVDYQLLKKHLLMLKRNEVVEKPVFDKQQHRRLEGKTERVEPKKIIILEGALANWDEQIRAHFDMQVYVECDNDVCISRTLQKLERELKPKLPPDEQAGLFEQYMWHYLHSIKPNFRKYVETCRKNCQLIIPNFSFHRQKLDLAFKEKEAIAVDMLHKKLVSVLSEKTLAF